MLSSMFDTAAALRIIYFLVRPITSFPAYKLGLIGENGEILRKPKTPEERAATSMLFRLIMRIRAFLSNIPLAQSKLGSYVSAYALVRECITNGVYDPTMEQLQESVDRISIMEEYANSEQILELCEEIANVTGAGTSTDKPVKRTSATFVVRRTTFDKFSKGKTKFKRWGKYLDLNDDTEQKIYDYATKNPRGILVLSDGERTKGIRYSKNGSGNWHGIKRKPKAIVESYLENQETEMEVVELC